MAMTEVDFSRDQCPDIEMVTLDASDSDKATQVNIPHWVKKLSVKPYGAKVRLSFTTASDDIHADHVECEANDFTHWDWWDGYNVANGVNKIYISNVTGETSTKVSVVIEGAR